MAAKTCLDCGAELTSTNRNWGSPRCAECMRVPLDHSKAFFQKTPLSEKDIQEYPVEGFTGKLLGYAVILLATMTVAAIVGYENARSFGGFLYGFVGGLVVIAAFRWHTARSSIHPLDTQRWYHFALVYSLFVIFAWVIAYMGLMPFNSMLGGSLFSFHVRFSQTLHMSAFWLVTLIALVAGVIGGLIGYGNIVRSDKRDKTAALIHYQRWKQSNA